MLRIFLLQCNMAKGWWVGVLLWRARQPGPRVPRGWALYHWKTRPCRRHEWYEKSRPCEPYKLTERQRQAPRWQGLAQRTGPSMEEFLTWRPSVEGLWWEQGSDQIKSKASMSRTCDVCHAHQFNVGHSKIVSPPLSTRSKTDRPQWWSTRSSAVWGQPCWASCRSEIKST